MIPAPIVAFLGNFFTNKWVIGIIALIVIFGSSYIYYDWSKSKIDKLQNENKILQTSVEAQAAALEKMQKDLVAISEAHTKFNSELKNLTIENKKTQASLYREESKKKPLGELAVKKPKLVENDINKATEDVFRCFESLAGGGSCD